MAEELTTPGEWEANRYDEIWAVEMLDGGAASLKVFVASVHDDEDAARSKANASLIAASKDLLALARIIGSAYPNDPGTSDLDDEQPVTISLGTVRRAWAALAKVDR